MYPQGNKNDSRERPDAKHIKMSEEAIRQLEKRLDALEKTIADAQHEAAAIQQILDEAKGFHTPSAWGNNELSAYPPPSAKDKALKGNMGQALNGFMSREALMAQKTAAGNRTRDATSHLGER